MFFFKKKASTPSFQTDPVGFLIWDADNQIQAIRTNIPLSIKEGAFDRAAFSCDSGLRCSLEIIALAARRAGEARQRPPDAAAAVGFLNLLERTVLEATAGKSDRRAAIHCTNFTHAMLAALLIGDFPRAQRLAALVISPFVVEEGGEAESGNVHDVIAKMLAAAVADDASFFAAQKTRFGEHRKLDRFFDRYFNYAVLMDLILKADTGALNAALTEQERTFTLRAQDRKCDHPQTLDACLDNNSRVIDVWATALARLARQRGLRVEFASTIIPNFDSTTP